jgi:hypothetical protein
MMAAGVETKTGFTATKPALLFSGYFMGLWPGTPEYDIAPDGRFLMLKESQAQSSPAQLNVVLNWFEELKSKSRAGAKP